MKKYIVGIDIGGTKCAITLGLRLDSSPEVDFEILEKICFHTEAHKGPDQVIERLINAIYKLLERRGLNAHQLLAIGISCGGPLDHEAGIIKNPPNLYGWNNIPIVGIMEKEFGVKAFLQNDANACALAEWKYGAGKGCRNMVFLTCGTGLGAGLILNGRLYNGANDMAGEIGHIRMEKNGPVGFGKAGSFEGFCSGNGIAQLARAKVLEKLQMGERPSFCPDVESLEKLSAHCVAQAAKDGDPLAKEIYRISGHYLGLGLSIIIDLLNPEAIILGSVYERSGGLMYEAMMEAIRQEALVTSRSCCKILPAKLGNSIGDYATMTVALHGGNYEE